MRAEKWEPIGEINGPSDGISFSYSSGVGAAIVTMSFSEDDRPSRNLILEFQHIVVLAGEDIVRHRFQLLFVALVAIASCQMFYNPLLDIPIVPDEATRSPPFRLYSDTTYELFIGLEPMPVDAATCAATYAAQGVTLVPSPCREIRPPFGEIHWTVTQRGQLVAQGSLPGEPADIPRDQSNSWAKSKTTTWGFYRGWFGHAGSDYVIEVTLKSTSLDLRPFHPRLAIVEPL